MEFSIIRISTEQALAVRHPVLRAGQDLKTAKFDIDYLNHTAHFGLEIEEKIIAVSTIFPDSEEDNSRKWQLRGMATLPDFRNNGIGTRLLCACEEHIKSQNGFAVWCNARKTAVKFYLKNGFEITSGRFDIPLIGPHFRMEKKL